jgi:MFS family permease
MAKRSMSFGMQVFSIIWFGQLVSTLGSGMTSFALGVWIYQETGSTTLFAFNLLAYALPNLFVAPFTGALVDRLDRRWMMILSDTGAGLSTLSVALLFFTGRLEVWHIYIATAVNASFSTIQWPAYSAATTLLVPKAQLGRASGMVQIGEAMSQLISPAVAGALLVRAGLQGVVLVDFATYLFAVFTLLLVRIPSPGVSAEGQEGRGSLLKEALYGWNYITARSGLFGLLLVFAVFNFLTGLTNPLVAPMILDMTSPEVLGYLASIVGIGMLAGTLVMSAWGGPKRRIHGVLGFLMLSGLFTALFGLRPSIPLIAVAGFGLMFTMPIINGSSQAIWQSKVAPDLQGRVFSVRVFKPLLTQDGALAGSVGRVVGVGPGRGTGLLFIVIGLLSALAALSGYFNPRVRLVEDELPDAIQDEGIAAPDVQPEKASGMPVKEGETALASSPGD